MSEYTRTTLRLNEIVQSTPAKQTKHLFLDVFSSFVYSGFEFAVLPLAPPVQKFADTLRRANIVLVLENQRGDPYQVTGNQEGVIYGSRGTRLVEYRFEGKPLPATPEPHVFAVPVRGRKEPVRIRFSLDTVCQS